MFRMAFVDDDRIFLTEAKRAIEKILAGEGANARIVIYDSPQKFWNDWEEGSLQKYDLYLLDVEMPEGSGLDLAEKIREADEKAILVFLSNYERFALNGYRVEARNYFLKTDWKEELGKWLPEFYRKWKRGREQIYWHDYNGKQCAIPVRDIIMLEYDSLNHQSKIHTREEEFTERKALKGILEELDLEDFVRVRKGCAVHLRYVEKLTEDEVLLKNGESVRISRNYKKVFLERYRDYLRRRI